MFEELLLNFKVKRLIISLVIGIFALGIVTDYSTKVTTHISNSVFRFHILANSDLEADQNLKIMVRDDILEYLSPILSNAKSQNEAKNIVSNNIKNIQDLAKKSVKKHGYNYNVSVFTGNYKFPQKQYDNITLPKGNYNALRIVIGNGEGHNWWCVLYPQLCFVGSSNGNMPNKSKLKTTLTEDEYNMITSGNVNFKLKIVELFSRN